ncbi:MAG: hypothetical protein RJA78_136 [Actinomycetota bacterium]|jgi:hypothetical protein
MAKLKKLPKFVKLVKPEKQVKNKFDVKAFAEVAAKAAAVPKELGAFIESVEGGEGLTSYFWAANQPGYVGWRWAVTVAQLDPTSEPTLCEVALIAGEDALAAPKWVPWSERLADYQALQAELEKQAALDAEEAALKEADEETEDTEEDSAEDVEEESEEELAVADSEVSEETEK